MAQYVVLVWQSFIWVWHGLWLQFVQNLIYLRFSLPGSDIQKYLFEK